MNKWTGIAIVSLISLTAALPGFASDQHFKRLTMQLDNDTFFDSDRQYTNGLRFTWSSEALYQFSDHSLIPRGIDALMSRLYPAPKDNDLRWVTVSFGQNIYTPDNLNADIVVKNDRPYAGVLYSAITLHQTAGATRYSTMLNIGLIGPSSMGASAMEGMHRRFDWRYPRGWDNQINNEPLLNLGFQWKYKSQWPDEYMQWGSAVLPSASAVLGNGYSGVSTGLEFMFGTISPGNFGLTQIIGEAGLPMPNTVNRRDGAWGITGYLALVGNWTWRNISLDGNTFRHSHHVSKRPLTSRLTLGFSIRLKDTDISFAHIFQSKEFKAQKKRHDYGVLSLTFHR